jgi:hypothetical protein
VIDLVRYQGMMKVYCPYTLTREGARHTTNNKVEIKYTFVNPNVDNKKIEDTLRQIISEKLLSMINQARRAGDNQ